MKISATEAGPAETAFVFIDEAGGFGRWLLLGGGEVVLRGEAGDAMPAPATSALAVPGDQVAIHWLDLTEGLTRAQAAAAARLLLADASAEPLSELHVAVGRAERGLTPVALLPSRRMADWLASAAAAGLDPELVIPTPLLLIPPAEGFVRRDRGTLCDFRGEAAAFSLEPELAEPLLLGAEPQEVSLERFESGLADILADPPLNLRQGAFARRGQWRVESGRARRLALLALALILLTLAVQVTMILRYTFAADALEQEASALAGPAGSAGDRDFSASAGLLFEAVQATPSVELTRLDYRPDGTLSATLQGDSPASLAAVGQRLEASGLAVDAGAPRNAGGRATAELALPAS